MMTSVRCCCLSFFRATSSPFKTRQHKELNIRLRCSERIAATHPFKHLRWSRPITLKDSTDHDYQAAPFGANLQDRFVDFAAGERMFQDIPMPEEAAQYLFFTL